MCIHISQIIYLFVEYLWFILVIHKNEEIYYHFLCFVIMLYDSETMDDNDIIPSLILSAMIFHIKICMYMYVKFYYFY